MIDKITFAFALGGSQGGDGRARRLILSKSPQEAQGQGGWR